MPVSSLTIIATRVRERREGLGLSQEALAERIGVHRTYLGGVERGERNLTIAVLDKIAAGLGCRPDDLLRAL